MNLQTRLTLASCLLALVISVVPVQSESDVETSSESSADRVKRRSFFNPWSATSRRNSVSLYEASNAFRAAPYAVPRPYYIPVYGAPGRPLLFYPPQTIYTNPGMPQDNPLLPSFGGPGYLPPKESPHFTGAETYGPPKETSSTSTIPSKTPQRIGGDDDDDGPVWGGSSGGMVQMPLSADQGQASEIRPTRPPMASIGLPTSPPLVHDSRPSSPSDSQSFIPPAQSQGESRPPMRATRPPPATQPPPLRTTTGSPSAAGPSDCVWAIVSCCSVSRPTSFDQNCFEQRGCPGPFWGVSPCEGDYARAAIAAAVNYYNTNPRNNFGK